MNEEIRIVGRERECCLLEKIYQESMTYGQVVWIFGASGVGKSALIQEFSHKKKNICIGKFDFVTSTVPYSVIVKILLDLCSILENENLTITIGPDTLSILSPLLPQIRNVTKLHCQEEEGGGGRGEYETVTRFEAIEKKIGERGFERLKEAIWVFMKEAIETSYSLSKLPTTIIVDDLQWVDDASLEILKPILKLGGKGGKNSWKGLLCIGAYRDNEVDDTTPFWQWKRMSSFETNGATWTELPLSNLTLSDVIEILSATLRQAPLQAESLGRLIHGVTRGNALFVRRYLQHIREQKCLSLNQNSDTWNADDEITPHVEVLSNNNNDEVIAFLGEEISNLPQKAASEILKIASCLGNNVDVDLLESIVHEFEIDMLQCPFISMLEMLETKCFIILDSDKRSFHFAHDRIHQAAYHLCNQEEDAKRFSLRLGRFILSIAGYDDSCHDSKSRSRFLQGVNQLNRGKELIDTAEDHENLARLNLKAAKEVLKFSALNVAQNHLETSLELLGRNCWDIHYDLTLAISNMLAAVLTGNGLMDQSIKLIDQISERSNCVNDRCEAQILKLEVLACMNQLDKCFELSQDIFAELNLPKLPLNPGLTTIIPAMLAVKKRLKPLTSEDILKLPRCENIRVQHAVKICKLENHGNFAIIHLLT
jgi:predicted ATPase